MPAPYYVNNLTVIGPGSRPAGKPRNGPYLYGNDLYVFFVHHEGAYPWDINNYIECWKSADQGATWAAMDNANRKEAAYGWFNCWPVGSSIYVAYGDPGGALAVVAFNCSTDTWGTSDTGGPNWTDPLASLGVSLCRRPTGAFLLVYGALSGVPQIEVRAVTWEPGGWGASFAVMTDDGAPAYDYRLLDAIISGSRVHVCGYYIGDYSLCHRSIAADDSLGSLQTVDADWSAASYCLRAVARSNGEVVVPYLHQTPSAELRVARAISTQEPVWSLEDIATAATPSTDYQEGLIALELAGALRVLWAYEPWDRVYENVYSSGAWQPQTELAVGTDQHAMVVSAQIGLINWWADGTPAGYYYRTYGELSGSRYYAF